MTSESITRSFIRHETARLLESARQRREPAAIGLTISAACAVAGAVCATMGVIRDPVSTWSVISANLLFWAGLAQGGVVFAASLHVAEARWGRLVERFALALGAFLPLCVLVMGSLWFGRTHLFPWYGDQALPPWLNDTTLVLRDTFGLVVMTLVSGAFAASVIKKPHDKTPIRRLAIAVVILFFPVFAMLAVDLGMTPDLRYHSTVYPVLYLSGCFTSALAATAISIAVWRRRADVRQLIPAKRVLDLGNLLWGFAIFCGYLWWCEFLVHWMGNLPDEAGRHLHQWHDWPWRILAWGSLACGVLVPSAVLFSRGVKRSSAAVGLTGAIALLGILTERLLDVAPALPVERGIGAALLSAGVCLGFAGAFALCYLFALRRLPLFPTEDPLFAKELATRHVKA